MEKINDQRDCDARFADYVNCSSLFHVGNAPMTSGNMEERVARATNKYVSDRGGHESKCCVHRLGYGCNCQVAEWVDAFPAGYRAAIATINSTPDSGLVTESMTPMPDHNEGE